jgi:hypothetical protein
MRMPCPNCRNPITMRYEECGDHFHPSLVCLCGFVWASAIRYWLIDGEYHVHQMP